MQPDPLFQWRAAETTDGPRPPSAIRARKPATPPDYTAQWCAFVEANHEIAAWILAEAQAMARTSSRVAVATLVEAARIKFRATINNSWRAPTADWLVTMEPRLGAVIERRKRTAAKAVAP